MALVDDIAKMEFETALAQLEEIVRILEEGKSSLRESVDLYEKGTMLKKHCDKILEAAQLRVNQISSAKENDASELSVITENISKTQ
jgi:exodeoxyribonuclease VII small subunit